LSGFSFRTNKTRCFRTDNKIHFISEVDIDLEFTSNAFAYTFDSVMLVKKK